VGILNSTRQTGSVLGVALFGSLVGRPDAFVAGAHATLITSACLLLAAAAAIPAARLVNEGFSRRTSAFHVRLRGFGA
jgi:DHA2 family methylenomycin A resistance protein-like MFS transporter